MKTIHYDDTLYHSFHYCVNYLTLKEHYIIMLFPLLSIRKIDQLVLLLSELTYHTHYFFNIGSIGELGMGGYVSGYVGRSSPGGRQGFPQG